VGAGPPADRHQELVACQGAAVLERDRDGGVVGVASGAHHLGPGNDGNAPRLERAAQLVTDKRLFVGHEPVEAVTCA